MKIAEQFSVTNPWLFINLDNQEIDVILTDNQNDQFQGYTDIAQLCFGMSLIWLRTRKTRFTDLATAEKEEVITNVVGNDNNADQIKNGKKLIGNGADIQINDIDSLPVGTRFLIFAPNHVTAAIKTSTGYILFDSNYGSEATYDLVGFKKAVTGCQLIAS